MQTSASEPPVPRRGSARGGKKQPALFKRRFRLLLRASACCATASNTASCSQCRYDQAKAGQSRYRHSLDTASQMWIEICAARSYLGLALLVLLPLSDHLGSAFSGCNCLSEIPTGTFYLPSPSMPFPFLYQLGHLRTIVECVCTHCVLCFGFSV